MHGRAVPTLSRPRPGRIWRSTAIAGIAASSLLLSCGRDDGVIAQEGAAPESVVPQEASDTTTPCPTGGASEAEFCGPSWQEQHDLNMRYADRYEFEGDLDAAEATAAEVEAALRSLVAAEIDPTEEQVADALRQFSEDVTVSSNAVEASGIGFGIQVAGGCVFGDLRSGTIDVEVGGFIHDGGCLALYAH